MARVVPGKNKFRVEGQSATTNEPPKHFDALFPSSERMEHILWSAAAKPSGEYLRSICVAGCRPRDDASVSPVVSASHIV